VEDTETIRELFESPDRLIDIRVSYKTRAQLPDEVRPKDTKPQQFSHDNSEDLQNVLGKRQNEQMQSEFEQPSAKRTKNY